MTKDNRQWILARRPVGDIKDGDLVLSTAPAPKAGKSQIVIRNEWLSLDPTNRVWMSDMRQYMPPVALGTPMRGLVVGEVVDSMVDSMPRGSFAMGIGSWSDYSCEASGLLSPVPDVPGISRKDVFGQFALVGPTAYSGLHDIGQPKIGETLVVSAAAGAVGSIAVQLGKAFGCKVIGIAGGKEKCQVVQREFGADATIDYREEGIDAALTRLCPEGIDIYFDNVGGAMLNSVLARMNVFGRVVQCGMISAYNDEQVRAAPANYPLILMNRLKVQGFIATDLYARYPEAIRALATLHLQGKLKWRYHEISGLEQADAAVRMLFSGANHGKLMVKVSNTA